MLSVGGPISYGIKVIMAVDDICFCFMSVSRVCGVVFGLWFAHLVEHMLF